MRTPYLAFMTVFVCVAHLGHSQSANWRNDSTFIKLTKWHDQEVGAENSGLYEGLLYPMVSKSRDTHQFFGRRGWSKGSILLKGSWYFDIDLALDIATQSLVLKHPNLGRRDGISMLMENVQEFTIAGHRFVHLPDKGLYDLLMEGNTFQLLSTRRKTERAEGGGVVYKEENKYFLQDASTGNILPLRGKKDLLVYHPEAAEISKQISRQQGLKLKMRDEQKLVAFTKAFDEEISN